MTRIALISKSTDLIQAGAQEVAGYPGLVLDCYPDTRTFLSKARGSSFHAILLDLKAFLTEKPQLREQIRDVEMRIPVIRLRADSGGAISAVYGDEVFSNVAGLVKSLAEKLCKTSQPVILRRYERKNVVLNARIHHPSFGAEPLLTHVTSLSEGGAFVICSAELPIGEMLEVEILETAPLSSFISTVRWTNSWGTPNGGFGGLGIEFAAASALQVDRIRQLVGQGIPLPVSPSTSGDVVVDEVIAELDRLLDVAGFRK